MHTVLRRVVLVAILAPSSLPAFAQTDALPQPLTLAAAVERALAANPAIAAARLQRPIDLGAVAAAGERPNPEVAYQISKETPHQSIGATWPIELGGKRARRIELANATMLLGDAELDRVITETRNEVRRAYFEAVASAGRLEISGDVRVLAVRARDAARARAAAGDVPQSDVTQSELALASSENEWIGARGEVAATTAELNTLLGRAPEAPLTLADSLALGTLSTLQDALGLATEANVEVQILDRRIAEQTARIALAQTMTTSDIAVGSALTYDAEPEFRAGWRFGAGVTVPLFGRHNASVVVETSTLARLKAERAALVTRISGSITAAVSRAAAARDQMAQYQTSILPLAVEAERQAQAAYDGGQVGLPVLVQALQTARDTRQRGLQAGLDYQRATADLERAIGASIK